MSRRFFVPAGVLAAFLAMSLVHQQLSAQDAPAQETPRQALQRRRPHKRHPLSSRQRQRRRHRAAPGAGRSGRSQRSYGRRAAGTRRVRSEVRASGRRCSRNCGRSSTTISWPTKRAERHWNSNGRPRSPPPISSCPPWLTRGVNAFRAAPNEDRELASFLVKLLTGLCGDVISTRRPPPWATR